MNTSQGLVYTIMFLICLSFVTLASAFADPGVSSLRREIDHVLSSSHLPTQMSLWIGNSKKPYFEYRANEVQATASAIKPAILLELFGNYEGKLDKVPEAASLILGDEHHPALRPFSKSSVDKIRQFLLNKTVREIGQVMIRSKLRENRNIKVTNAQYNAATNLAIALLGGPAGLTTRLAERSPGLNKIVVRRYMLAKRRGGDNTATAKSLSRLNQMLASGRVPGLSKATVESVREVLYSHTLKKRGRYYLKTGTLYSNPVTRVKTGWFEKNGRVIAYTIMAQRVVSSGISGKSEYKNLDKAVQRILLKALGFAERF